MSFLDAIPASLRELFPYLTTSALTRVDPLKTAGVFAALTRNMLLKKDYDRALANAKKFLPETVRLVDHVAVGGLSADTMPDDGRRAVGEQLLQIYFAQLLSPGPQFIDFRLTHFAWVTENAVLEWCPSSAQISFDDKFLRGIRDVYRGFYGHNDSQFVAGFETLGILSPETTPANREKTVAAFKRHLLGADVGPVVFSTEKFTASFRELFALLAEEDTKLSPDFAVFGLMLASLHLALESLGVGLDCAQSFRAAEARCPK